MSECAGAVPESENDLVLGLLTHLEACFGANCPWAREVRSHGTAHTDVLLACGDEVIAIEAKLYQWQRAVGQAVLNRFCADRSYIAVPAGTVRPLLIETAVRYGIGILAVGAEGVEIVAEAPVAAPSPGRRAALAAHLASGARS